MRVCYQAWWHIRATGKSGGSAEMGIAGRQWSVIGLPGKAAHRYAIPGYNDLGTVNKSLVSEWDYDKNREALPKGFTQGSKKKVWWRCNAGHSWKAAIYSRNGGRRNCPYCSGKRVLAIMILQQQTLPLQRNGTMRGTMRNCRNILQGAARKKSGGDAIKAIAGFPPSITVHLGTDVPIATAGMLLLVAMIFLQCVRI